MTTIHQAERPHGCEMVTWRDTMPVGSVVRCDICGMYWLRRTTYVYWVEHWHPVGWWNFAARRRIREHLAAEMEGAAPI